ncbi:class I SAM-dependent methyltransferase [Streptomyces sp. WAC06614]|uniref:class I SAM-dependent methyltransferase n=1 Tax=Streptomyces sp. WAC06614 TaxID=2487416 RepID=UPI000F795784|nr:methyltransferase domain-containing protein [Streptomyces sp. WAC06614]RSS78489.1 class I SAM-dependent methyltransferase [Streptomyces sp. WAC06614]
MTDLNEAVEADRALKAKHRTLWSLGDYPAVAATVVSALGPRLVQACGVQRGDRVLDVAAGSGNAAIPAALTGADVVASDLTPALLDAGRVLAEERGAQLAWREADAEALPFEDGEFDVVMSCLGVMFAPHHQTAADELVRVCRDGGTVGVLHWTPEGFIGRMFSVMRPYAPPPPPGAGPPPLWGDEEHVATLLGDRVTDLDARRETVRVDRFATPEEFVDFFKAVYGPTIATYKFIGDDPDRVAALDRDLVALARDAMTADGAMEWEYLLLTAHRRVG